MIAEDRYSARDALELIDVEYDPLPAVVNARKALDPDAPLIRDDKQGQTDNLATPLWEAGDAEEADRVFAEADIVVEPRHDLPPLPPGAARDLRNDRRHEPGDGSARSSTTATRRRTLHRTVYAQVAGLPEHMIRIMTNDIGGGFGNKVADLSRLRLRDRRLDPHRQAGQVGRGPLREPDVDRLRARLRDERADLRQGRQDHGRPGRRDRRPRRLRLDRPAVEVPRRLLPHLRRLLRPGGGPLQRQGRLHEQGAGRGRLPLLVPGHRGDLPGRAPGRRAGAEDGRRSGPSCG